MNCDIIKDLIPLYIDECCSEESKQQIEEHINNCDKCKKHLEDMKSPSDIIVTPQSPKTFSRLNDWKASILQSILLFISFGLITLGVALEAGTPSGLLNGFWASNIVIPATGFMLSLPNWYFLRVYKSRKSFSNCSFIATIVITVSAYIWLLYHYDSTLLDVAQLFADCDFADFFEMLYAIFALNKIGVILTVSFCALSKILSNLYAKMMGKE